MGIFHSKTIIIEIESTNIPKYIQCFEPIDRPIFMKYLKYQTKIDITEWTRLAKLCTFKYRYCIFRRSFNLEASGLIITSRKDLIRKRKSMRYFTLNEVFGEMSKERIDLLLDSGTVKVIKNVNNLTNNNQNIIWWDKTID